MFNFRSNRGVSYLILYEKNFKDTYRTVEVETGETIATAVGFRQNGSPNVSFDFGVYLDKYGKKGLCWLDLLPPEDTASLKALPGGDHQSGKSSDYCH